MPNFNKSKGFKLRSGNAPLFKEVGSSKPGAPLSGAGFGDGKNDSKLVTRSMSDVYASNQKDKIEKAKNPTLGVTLGSLSQAKFENDQNNTETEVEKIARENRESNKDKAGRIRKVTNPGTGTDTPLDTDTPPPKEEKWFEKQAWKDSGIGHMVDAFKSIRKGIKNNKAKRTKKVEEAKTAVESGTETLKQAKLVDRAKAKEAKKAKKAAKDKKKLAEYKKKRKTKSKS